MKARYKSPLSRADQAMVNRIMDECWEQRKKEQDKCISRVFKMTCLVLCEEWGFGQKRLERFATEMQKRSDDVAEKPEMWYLIDEKLHSLGIFIGEDEDIDERVEHTKQLRKEEGRKFRDY